MKETILKLIKLRKRKRNVVNIAKPFVVNIIFIYNIGIKKNYK